LPTLGHLEYVKTLIERLPQELKKAVRDPVEAEALIYALLSSRERDVAQIQDELIKESADAGVVKALKRIRPVAAGLSPALRLPAAELATGVLKGLSGGWFKSFCGTMDGLISADKKVDLFEFCLRRMIKARLAPVYGKTGQPRGRSGSLKALLPHVSCLLSGLAHEGSEDPDKAREAFRKAAQTLGKALTLEAPGACGVDRLDESLTLLSSAVPMVRKKILEACVVCVAADGKVTVVETELLRAVSDSLDCPLPPFLPENPGTVY
jgi:hypothetical protein